MAAVQPPSLVRNLLVPLRSTLSQLSLQFLALLLRAELKPIMVIAERLVLIADCSKEWVFPPHPVKPRDVVTKLLVPRHNLDPLVPHRSQEFDSVSRFAAFEVTGTQVEGSEKSPTTTPAQSRLVLRLRCSLTFLRRSFKPAREPLL